MISNVEEIYINELYTYPSVHETIREILRFKDRTGANIKFRLHDYYCICPSVSLVDDEDNYCEIAEEEKCTGCVKCNKTVMMGGYDNIRQFRSELSSFIKKCDEVTVFSKASLDILKRAYPDVDNVKLSPHIVEPLSKPVVNRKEDKGLVIGVLGTITVNKGRRIIEEMLSEIKASDKSVKICIIGKPDEEIEDENLIVTGPYVRDELTALVEKHEIDIFIIPSIWPETFSYTTSEVISMDMPLAVFNLGAPPERVGAYEKGLVIEKYEGAKALLDTLEKFGETIWNS